MASPELPRVYLRPLEDPLLPARHSVGARRRTAQLQGFLRELQRVGRDRLGLAGRVELIVAGREDWARLSRYPYGLPFTRVHGRDSVGLVAAAGHPPRLLHRFDDALLRAARAGVSPPGEVREFLDLLLGREWGHAAVGLLGLRTGRRWLDAFLATYLCLLALADCGASGVSGRLLAWAELGAVAGPDRPPDLDEFAYPLGTLPPEQLLWFHGLFTRRAAELIGRRGWDVARDLVASLPRSGNRGRIARLLLEIDPVFGEWFPPAGLG